MNDNDNIYIKPNWSVGSAQRRSGYLIVFRNEYLNRKDSLAWYRNCFKWNKK